MLLRSFYFYVVCVLASIAIRQVPFLPSLKVDLPRLSLAGIKDDDGDSAQAADRPGYFDVLYLDEDCLIISQVVDWSGLD